MIITKTENGQFIISMPVDVANALTSLVKDAAEDEDKNVVWEDWAADAIDELNEALQSD